MEWEYSKHMDMFSAFFSAKADSLGKPVSCVFGKSLVYPEMNVCHGLSFALTPDKEVDPITSLSACRSALERAGRATGNQAAPPASDR